MSVANTKPQKTAKPSRTPVKNKIILFVKVEANGGDHFFLQGFSLFRFFWPQPEYEVRSSTKLKEMKDIE
ncbi:MAG: hypothetical protein LBU91_02345 [Bacteroidales bacterium]|jgi:hypothetical protein|nr:hypothetical protein [Bacteroidales bacterium]